MEILLHVQKIFEVEYVCMVDAEYRIAASVNTPHQGEIFNPAGIVAAAKARDAAVFTTTVLSYEDLLRERPPLFRDRESALDMAMVGESQPAANTFKCALASTAMRCMVLPVFLTCSSLSHSSHHFRSKSLYSRKL
jgi:hypothetical protein